MHRKHVKGIALYLDDKEQMSPNTVNEFYRILIINLLIILGDAFVCESIFTCLYIHFFDVYSMVYRVPCPLCMKH